MQFQHSNKIPQAMLRRVHRHWGRLSDKDVAYLEKDRAKFLDIVLEHYCLSSSKVQEQIDQWESEYENGYAYNVPA